MKRPCSFRPQNSANANTASIVWSGLKQITKTNFIQINWTHHQIDVSPPSEYAQKIRAFAPLVHDSTQERRLKKARAAVNANYAVEGSPNTVRCSQFPPAAFRKEVVFPVTVKAILYRADDDALRRLKPSKFPTR